MKKCPFCGIAFISKPKMAREILKKLKYPKDKSPYNDGTFTREEMFWIYRHVIRTTKGEVNDEKEYKKDSVRN